MEASSSPKALISLHQSTRCHRSEYGNIHSPANLKIVPCIHTYTVHNRISRDYPDELDLTWLQTWSRTPGKKSRLRLDENRVLRKTVGPNWDKEAEE
jgi:hypothetical protein